VTTTELVPTQAPPTTAPAVPDGRVPVDWRRMRTPFAGAALACSLFGAIGTSSGSVVAGRLAEHPSVGLVRLLAL